MSTEQKHDPETTLLAEKLTTWWAQFKQGQLIPYRVMALILLIVTGIGLYLYINSERAVGVSKTWLDLEGRNTLTQLTDFAKENPNSVPGKVAEFNAARVLLGPDGISKIAEATDEAQRKKAVDNIEQARDALNALVDQFKNDPVLRAECYLGLAKAEAALIGITKEGSTDFRGTVAGLVGYVDKLAEAADGTPWGDEAKKLAESLKAPSSPLAEEINRVQIGLYRMDPRLAPGGGPLTPGGGPLGRIPGLPGGEGGTFGGPLSPPAPKSGTGFVPAGAPASTPGPIAPPDLTAPGAPATPSTVPPTTTVPPVPVPGGPVAPPGAAHGPAAPGSSPPAPTTPPVAPPIAPPAAPPGATPPATTPPGPVSPPAAPKK